MNGEKTLLNELRLLNIALRRGMNAEVPSVSSMVLHFVFMRGGNVLQKEVENEFDLRRSTASQLLRRLEENGSIRRTHTETDGRSKRIYLSDTEMEEQQRICHRFRTVEAYLESALTPDEKDTFFVLCGKIRKLFDCPVLLRGGYKL